MPKPCPQPLSSVRPGEPVRLVKVLAGKRLTYRLAELGLTPGVEVEVLQDAGGPMLLCFRNCRLAIGRGVAKKIQVLPCETCAWATEIEADTI